MVRLDRSRALRTTWPCAQSPAMAPSTTSSDLPVARPVRTTRRVRRSPRVAVALAALLCLACTVAPAAGAASANHAAGLGYGGYVDTSFNLGKELLKPLVMAARFMPKYAYTGEGPVFGIRGKGQFYIGIGNFRELQRDGWKNYQPDAKIVIAVAGQKAVYPVNGDPGKSHVWRHLAVRAVPTNAGITHFGVYLDGERLDARRCLPPSGGVHCPKTEPADDISVTRAGMFGLKGFLRIGQTTAKPLVSFNPVLSPDTPFDDPGLQLDIPSSDLQFYGFIDDVAMLRGDLPTSTIKQLSDATRLTGNEKNVVAAYTFDRRKPNGERLTGSFRRKTTFVNGRSARVRVSRTRSNNRINKEDRQNIAALRPSQVIPWTLPFAKRQEWKVWHGNSTPNSSHNGFATFAWDFALADPTLENAKTCGQDLHAVASGSVYEIDDSGTGRPDLELHPDGANVLKIRHNLRERSTYLHLQTGSVRALFTPAVPPPDIAVMAGQRIARVGTRQEAFKQGLVNCHLHLGSAGTGEATVPAEFSNYEVKDPATGKWKFVSRGAPETDQIIRRP